jgi:transcriptional regulator with XRE-family HTH domain
MQNLACQATLFPADTAPRETTVVDQLATDRVGALIRTERIRQELSISKLAHQAGVSPATLSRIERGKIPGLTIAMADRLLGALGLRLHVDTVPLWAEIDEMITAAGDQPLAERMRAWEISVTGFVASLEDVPYLLDGLIAAAVQGAPVPVREFEIAVPREDAALDRLTDALRDLLAQRGEGFEHVDPRRDGSDYYRTLAGRLRFRLIDEYRPRLWADLELSPDGTSWLRKTPPARARVAVVPLAELEVTDGLTRRVIERIRARRG